MDSKKRNMFLKEYHTAEMLAYFDKLSEADEGYGSGAREAMEKAGFGGLNMPVWQGRILETLVRALNVKKAVEIGALGGYAAHWIARAMAEGARLYSLEADPALVTIAKEALEISGLSKKVTVLEGEPLENLKTLSKLAPFDFCYISLCANHPACLRWAAANLRPGGLVAADGVFFKGRLRPEGGETTSSLGGSPLSRGQRQGPASALGGQSHSRWEGVERSENAGARAMREFFHVLFDADRFVSASILPTDEGLALGVK